MVKTKIVATLGPATDSPESIESLIEAGVDVFRLNFSHGRLDGHGKTLGLINEVRKKFAWQIAVMGDLCGPKIRLTDIQGGSRMLKADEQILIKSGLSISEDNLFGTNYKDFENDLRAGERVLIDDGQIELAVMNVDEGGAVCRVIRGGVVRSHKGINLPDSEVSTPSITEYDYKCIDWAVNEGIDFLALSFVQAADDMRKLRSYLEDRESEIKIISKIEKPLAVKNLEEIIDVSDAVLVARGDLGVEMELAQVPLIQKRITDFCRNVGKPVIVATQMLQSMIHSSTPTRAEVSDLANAVMDYTDAVMLSGETAVGDYPLDAVLAAKETAEVTEKYLDESDEFRPAVKWGGRVDYAALARAVAHLIDHIDVKMTAAWCENGQLAQLLSKARIDVPIAAFTSDERIARQMALHFGIIAIAHPVPKDIAEFDEIVDRFLCDNSLASPGDTILTLPQEELIGQNTKSAVIIRTVG